MRYEDPTIQTTARVEAVRLWDSIELQVADGIPFHVARERVLAENIGDIGKAFGKDVASRVTSAIEGRAPHTVSKSAKAGRRAIIEQMTLDSCVARKGRLSWLDRISMKLFGVVWS